MPNMRKGDSTGVRAAKPALPGDCQLMITATVEDCRRIASRAGRADLIEAHRYCDRNPALNKARKEVIAAALRKLEAGDKLEAGARRAAGLFPGNRAGGKGGAR